MTREEMEKYIGGPLCKELYYKLKNIYDKGYQDCNKALEQEPKWIPVSEKLPEKNVWVLVTVEQNGKRYQEIMRRYNYREAWTDDIDIYTDEITAWMPLPESYKSESEVEE